jgi:hypothetical protein
MGRVQGLQAEELAKLEVAGRNRCGAWLPAAVAAAEGLIKAFE